MSSHDEIWPTGNDDYLDEDPPVQHHRLTALVRPKTHTVTETVDLSNLPNYLLMHADAQHWVLSDVRVDSRYMLQRDTLVPHFTSKLAYTRCLSVEDTLFHIVQRSEVESRPAPRLNDVPVVPPIKKGGITKVCAHPVMTMVWSCVAAHGEEQNPNKVVSRCNEKRLAEISNVDLRSIIMSYTPVKLHTLAVQPRLVYLQSLPYLNAHLSTVLVPNLEKSGRLTKTEYPTLLLSQQRIRQVKSCRITPADKWSLAIPPSYDLPPHEWLTTRVQDRGEAYWDQKLARMMERYERLAGRQTLSAGEKDEYQVLSYMKERWDRTHIDYRALIDRMVDKGPEGLNEEEYDMALWLRRKVERLNEGDHADESEGEVYGGSKGRRRGFFRELASDIAQDGSTSQSSGKTTSTRGRQQKRPADQASSRRQPTNKARYHRTRHLSPFVPPADEDS